MEQLNKVELRGIVGSCNISKVGELSNVRFSVATNYCFTDRGGNAVVETTWHSCNAWTDKCPKAAELKKGDGVHLFGRIRNSRFTDFNGNERTYTEIVVNELEILSNR